jgi:hypothetical protein
MTGVGSQRHSKKRTQLHSVPHTNYTALYRQPITHKRLANKSRRKKPKYLLYQTKDILSLNLW